MGGHLEISSNSKQEHSTNCSSLDAPDLSVIGGEQFWDDIYVEDHDIKSTTPNYNSLNGLSDDNHIDFDTLKKMLEASEIPQPRSELLYSYQYSFTGSQLEEWITGKKINFELEDSIKICQKILDNKIIQKESSKDPEQFNNDNTLYTLSTIPGGTTKNIPRLDIDQIM